MFCSGGAQGARAAAHHHTSAPHTHTRNKHTHLHHTHAHPGIAWRFVCGPPAEARCCHPPPHARTAHTHTGITSTHTHTCTLLGASHVAGARCCRPPHARILAAIWPFFWDHGANCFPTRSHPTRPSSKTARFFLPLFRTHPVHAVGMCLGKLQRPCRSRF